jgi:hypothetical protein
MTAGAPRARQGAQLPLGLGARFFSQFAEDGLLLYVDAVLGLDRRSFVDIGAAVGIKSDCAKPALILG